MEEEKIKEESGIQVPDDKNVQVFDFDNVTVNMKLDVYGNNNNTKAIVNIQNAQYTLNNFSFIRNNNCIEACFDKEIQGNEVNLEVSYADLRQLEKLSKSAENVLKKYKILEEFQECVKVFKLKIRCEHYSLMAQSLIDSCKLNESKDANTGVQQIIKGVIDDKGKEKFCVFLSAITSINGQKTIEYHTARYINFALKKCGIGAFWWEDKALNDKDWFISSKIATGLALSSIFVSLAYDSVKVKEDRKVDFTCFDEKTSPCFKYENDTFKNFLTDTSNSKNGDQASNNKSAFDTFIVGFDEEKKDKFPEKRILKVFSYGEPSSHVDNNKFFDNLPNMVIATPMLSTTDDKEKIKVIFNRVLTEIFDILNSDEKVKSLCPNVDKRCLQSKQSKEDLDKYINKLWKQADKKFEKDIKTKRSYNGTDYSYLYRSFGDVNYTNVEYCDNFLGAAWAGLKDNKYSYMVPSSKENIEAVPSSKENIEAVPSDFEFKYAIVDENGKNAKNHFLVFPERYNDENGNCKWRMKLVVRDWNLRAIVDDSYRKYLLGKGTELNENKLNETKLNEECFPLSKYSKIKFYKDKTDFITGYNESEGLTEQASEYATCKTYSDNQDETKDGRTNVASKYNNGVNNHCAFILNEDVLDELNPKYHLKGFLKLVSDSLKEVKSFYISVIFYPKPVVYNKKTAKLPLRRKTETRCPYCGRKSVVKENSETFDQDYCCSKILSVNESTYCSCQHNFIGELYYLDGEDIVMSNGVNRNGVITIGSENQGKVYGAFLSNGYKLSNFRSYLERFDDGAEKNVSLTARYDSRLVYDNCYKNGAVVTMVGLSQSGKSTFISRMLSVHSDGDYQGHISCSYLNNAMKPYVKSVKSVPVKTVQMVKTNKTSPAFEYGINGVRLLEDYKSSKYSEFLSSTQNDQKEPVLPHTPFTIVLEMNQNSRDNEKSFLSFFDLPGGLFGQDGKGTVTLGNLHDDYTMLHHSDSIILLLSIDNPGGNASMIQAITRRISKGAIVAVVFCKADELFVDTNYKWEHITRSTPIARDNKFNGSKRQAYIDECSKEIEKELSYKGNLNIKAMMETLKSSLKGYPYKFFAISALGRGDSIVEGVNAKKYTLYETTPLNIENVLLWIMFEKGIIE